MGILEATKKWYKNWGNYKGISEREEYWLGLGGAAIIMCILYGIMRVLQTFSGDLQYLDWLRIASTTSVVVYAICAIITFFAFLCATARRLHDVNKSDWYLLVLLIPAVGEIILLVLLMGPSVINDNPYRNNETKKEAK